MLSVIYLSPPSLLYVHRLACAHGELEQLYRLHGVLRLEEGTFDEVAPNGAPSKWPPACQLAGPVVCMRCPCCMHDALYLLIGVFNSGLCARNSAPARSGTQLDHSVRIALLASAPVCFGFFGESAVVPISRCGVFGDNA